MQILKFIYYIIIITFALEYSAQTIDVVKPASTSTDCPSWNTKHANNRADFLEYLRNTKGKSVSIINNSYMISGKTNTINKLRSDTLQSTVAKNDFYTKKRYNLVPNKSETPKVIPNQSSVRADGSASDVHVQNHEKLKLDSELVTDLSVQQSKSELPAIENLNEPTTANKKDAKVTAKNINDGNSSIEKNKSHTSRFKRKITHIFSKKTNKAAKPNYTKCTTSF